MTSNNNDLISRAAVIRAIRNHINVNRERADRGYAAMIREEDIKIIEGVPGVKNKHMRALAFTAIGYRERKARRQSGNYCPNCGARMINGGNYDG